MYTQNIARLMEEMDESLAVVETGSGGLISAACLSMPGASGWFRAGHIAYSHHSKDVLGFDKSVFIQHGSVSVEAVRHMARQVRQREGATIGLCESSIMGPSGGSAVKPVGMVLVGLCVGESVVVFHHRVRGDCRSENMKEARNYALQDLHRWLGDQQTYQQNI